MGTGIEAESITASAPMPQTPSGFSRASIPRFSLLKRATGWIFTWVVSILLLAHCVVPPRQAGYRLHGPVRLLQSRARCGPRAGPAHEAATAEWGEAKSA